MGDPRFDTDRAGHITGNGNRTLLGRDTERVFPFSKIQGDQPVFSDPLFKNDVACIGDDTV